MHKKYLFILLIFCTTQALMAQVRYSDDGQIENTEILIEKNKKITFPEKSKQTPKANVTKKTGQLSEAPKYNLKEIPSNIPDLETKMRILSVKDEASTKFYQNFIRGGAGNYGTTYLEGSIVTKPNPTYQVGLHAKHFASMFGTTSDNVHFKENSGNSSNFIQAFGKSYLKKALLSATADYERKGVYFYGYAKDYAPKSKDDIYQAFNIFTVKTNLKSIDTLTKIDYDLKAEFYNLSDRYKASENEILVSGTGKYEINDFYKILLQGSFSQSTRKDTNQISRTLFNIKPQLEYLFNDKLTVRGGFNLAIENDTVKSGNIKNVHIYPVINADYQLFEKVSLFGGMDGGMEKNTLRTLVNQNPWLSSNIPLAHTNRSYEFYAGLQGNLFNYFYFKTMPSYANYKYMNFFVNAASDSAKFNVAYDTKGTGVFKFANEVVFEKSQSFKLGLRVDYYAYSMGSLTQPWHKPTFEATVFSNLNLYNKLFFYADIFYISGIKGNNASNLSSDKFYTLPDIIDVSLKVDYKFSDKLSLFVYGYNLAGQNYMRFNNYPVKGVNLVGGASFMF